jgi:hypothetical protein
MAGSNCEILGRDEMTKGDMRKCQNAEGQLGGREPPCDMGNS